MFHINLKSPTLGLKQFFGPRMDFCREGGPATNTTTKRHGTVDHDDGTPQLSNCRKLEACMSTHHQKGSSNIKVIRNSSISDSECFLTREIKDLMTFQDSLYVCKSYYLFYYNWTIQQKLS